MGSFQNFFREPLSYFVVSRNELLIFPVSPHIVIPA